MDWEPTREAESRVVALEWQMSESLQLSLLTEPVQPDGLQVAVRYQPAAEQAHIGGDWYDAFLLPGGRPALAVGDVTGHDHRAAAAMAQVRNLLRGVAYPTDGTPRGAGRPEHGDARVGGGHVRGDDIVILVLQAPPPA